jgi:hypothetical protein
MFLHSHRLVKAVLMAHLHEVKAGPTIDLVLHIR